MIWIYFFTGSANHYDQMVFYSYLVIWFLISWTKFLLSIWFPVPRESWKLLFYSPVLPLGSVGAHLWRRLRIPTWLASSEEPLIEVRRLTNKAGIHGFTSHLSWGTSPPKWPDYMTLHIARNYHTGLEGRRPLAYTNFPQSHGSGFAWQSSRVPARSSDVSCSGKSFLATNLK